MNPFKSHEETTRISIIGLGYVGLPVAMAFSRHFEVVGYDIDSRRIQELNNLKDVTYEVSSDELKESSALFTNDITKVSQCNFHIIAVPTPIDKNKKPNLSALESATRDVASILKKGDIVVYESTVFPGATEEICLPILESISNLIGGTDFKIGYSPERINPGDKEHTFTKIKKVVSGQDQQSLDKISKIYGSVVDAGVFKAQSIRVAEAAKVIENTQRDVNIALMNELSLFFDKMDIDTYAVLEAAYTKWNFLKFKPGLVGGHCIGVDPYYLTHKAAELNYYPEVILSGRKINDSMGRFMAQKLIKTMIHQGLAIKGQRVSLFGLTFKENCPDLRNTRVLDLINELQEYGIQLNISDPQALPSEAKELYDIELIPFSKMPTTKVSVVAVPHKEYVDLSPDDIPSDVIFDIKGIFRSYSGFKTIVSL